MVGGEDQHYQAESLGISSYREGAGNQESSETTRKIYSISLASVAGTGLDGMGASSRSGEGITAVFEQAGTPDGNIIASKVFMLLEFTQKIEVRTGSVREKARTTGGVKSVQPPSSKEATPLSETPRCGELLKLSLESSAGNCGARSRLIAEPDANNVRDVTMDNPQGYCLSALWKHMAGSQRLNGCRSTMKDDQSRVGLRYSPAIRESVWIY